MYIGIDPGLNGALGAIDKDGKYIDCVDMPTLQSSKSTREVSGSGIKNWISLFDSIEVISIERVNTMPGQGVSSQGKMMHSLGMVRGVCHGMGLKVKMVPPQEWKKYFKLSSDKELSRGLAIQMWPDAPLDRKKDHDKAEALLIAEYVRLILI